MTTARPMQDDAERDGGDAAHGGGEHGAERGQGHAEVDDEAHDEQAAPRDEALGHGHRVVDGQPRLDAAERDERARDDERVEHHLDRRASPAATDRPPSSGSKNSR